MSVDLTPVRHFVEVLEYVRAEKARLTELEKAARTEIEAVIGDEQAGDLDGHTVITWETTKRTALSQSVLKRDYPDVAAACMGTTEVRRFLVVDR